MNLEARLTDTLDDVLRTSGYIFEMINNNKRQSNLITGPNNQLIPPQVTNQLSLSIAQFDLILDEAVSKFNDARWCVEQMVENKQKEELRVQEERERLARAEADKKRKEEEEALRKREEEKKAADERAKKEEEERLQREAKEKRENELREADERKQKAAQPPVDDGFDFDMDLEKGLDIPNPSDILSSISYKDGQRPDGKTNKNIDGTDLDMNNVLGGDQSLLDDLNMNLLGKDFDGGLGGAEEEFDVDNFLNQFGNGD